MDTTTKSIIMLAVLTTVAAFTIGALWGAERSKTDVLKGLSANISRTMSGEADV